MLFIFPIFMNMGEVICNTAELMVMVQLLFPVLFKKIILFFLLYQAQYI